MRAVAAVVCALTLGMARGDGVSDDPTGEMQLYLFNGTVANSARCMDSSVYGVYIANATNASLASRFVLFMEGGGACYNQTVRHWRAPHAVEVARPVSRTQTPPPSHPLLTIRQSLLCDASA
jgi:Pectinacetylesterase